MSRAGSSAPSPIMWITVFAGREKVVGDDLAMAAPPFRLGAHDGAGMRLAKTAKLIEAGLEGRRGCVIGVVAERLVLPVTVRRWALVFAPAPESPSSGMRL